MPTTAEWISYIVTALSAGVTVGFFLSKFGALESRVKVLESRTEDSSIRQGQRLGELGDRLTVLETRLENRFSVEATPAPRRMMGEPPPPHKR